MFGNSVFGFLFSLPVLRQIYPLNPQSKPIPAIKDAIPTEVPPKKRGKGRDEIPETLGMKTEPKVIVSFGDSLTSSTHGRWTDGLTWVEHVARLLQVKLDNRAYGGATSGRGTFRGRWPSVVEQVEHFVSETSSLTVTSSVPSSPEAHHIYPPQETVYTIWVGGNDYIQILKQSYMNGDLSRYGEAPRLLGEVISVPNNVVHNIETSMDALIHGPTAARHFLVFNLPPLHQTPLLSNVHPLLKMVVRTWVKWHNHQLEKSVRSLAKKYEEHGVSVTMVDSYRLMNECLKNPKKYGIDDVDTPVHNFGKNEHRSDMKKRLFYDPIHPSGVAHQVLAQEILKMLKKEEKEVPAHRIGKGEVSD
eukprot:TRINITY_DN224_c0_g2_i1.p1 TRINITY_DN224_c0_g2~~TRINITY_DN224_c0_g2_i1.p1  ORF type:complete len:361 (-),score=79.46 TRINITY_DN224_c0_g2_i1:221-1303(-)